MATPNCCCSRETEVKAFDDTKTGVKLRLTRNRHNTTNAKLEFPLLDLEGVADDPIKREAVVDAVHEASETWGFFQVINHGIPEAVLDEMIDGVRRFFGQDEEERKKWYTRDLKARVVYNTNFDLYSAPSANWRDTVYCEMAPHLPQPEELPAVCRDIMIEYTKQVMKLGRSLFQIISEALGLKADHLVDMKCTDGLTMLLHYYPECPQPELTLGASKHADSDFLTVLLTDQVRGLQVLYKNQWVDVPSVPGALVVNIGDLLQLVSNDRFVSAEHRVVVNSSSPRVSVACFISNAPRSTEIYGPIEELVSEDNPARYRATAVEEYATHYRSKGLDGTSALSHFRV
ncbi:1-aminocyclopropane-1-carboxylate oxidase 1-like [Salvia divinorum]|uniref:1-aminocyclopropane-1-carboxylate oxidase 1-like n=1 Tax=Salvia divinorum TaxID=28513 RepID=A0ABD1FV47_SALDI